MKLNELYKKENKSSAFKSLFKLEAKLNLKSFLIFTLIAVSLLVFVVSLYPLFEEMFQNINNPALLTSSDLMSYYNSQISQQWILLPLIYASFLGYNLVVNNFKSGSSVILYTQNLSRSKIIFTKLLVLVVNIVLLNIISALAGFITLSILNFSAINVLNFLIFTLIITAVTLVMGLIMFGLSLIYLKKISPFISIALPIILIFVSSVGLLVKDVNFLKYISPTSIINIEGVNHILSTGFNAVNLISLALWFGAALVLLISGFVNFRKKDLI